MRKKPGFSIDKITNSIEEIATGRTFETEMILVTTGEIKTVNKKDGTFFNWKTGFKEGSHQFFKRVPEGDTSGFQCRSVI